tara:strand:+ start:4909 stop:5805 length:897 start_codon:yes stop_codon:yes gene_type:complete
MTENNKIICSETGKTLSGYDGNVTIDVEFGDQCRYYIFKDLTLHLINGEIDVEKSFPNIETYEVEEFYPKIKAKIISPFSNIEYEFGVERPTTDIMLRDSSLDDEVSNMIDNYLGRVDNDSIAEAAQFSETTKLSFYELWLPTKDGKYRGYMEINFKDIHTEADLLETIQANALENYEWYQTSPEDVLDWIKDKLIAGLYDWVWVPAVQKQIQADYLDIYTLTTEIGYLIRKNRHEDVLTLCQDFPHKIDISELNNEIGSDEWMQCKGYKSIVGLVKEEFLNDNHLKESGEKILSIFS